MTTDIERLKRMALNAGGAEEPCFAEPEDASVCFRNKDASLQRFARAIAEDCAKAGERALLEDGTTASHAGNAIRALYR